MRNDAGVNGDAQRIEQIAWILFLKVYAQKEEDWELNETNYQSIIPKPCRWENWADNADGHAMTGEKLLNFVNNTLFPVLRGKNIEDAGGNILIHGVRVTPDTPIQKAIVQTVFTDANNYMKDGVLLRQVIDKINELNLDDYEESHAFGRGILYAPRRHGFHGENDSPENRGTYGGFRLRHGRFSDQLAERIKNRQSKSGRFESMGTVCLWH